MLFKKRFVELPLLEAELGYGEVLMVGGITIMGVQVTEIMWV